MPETFTEAPNQQPSGTITPTRSAAYRLARYTILPELRAKAAEFGDEPFLLREVALPLIESHVSPEHRDVHVPFAQAEGGERYIQTVKWYVSYLAKELNEFENLGRGIFRNRTEADIADDEITESALEEGDDEAGEFDGWIYAFSFPAIIKNEGPFPIKIGKTVGDVDTRVMDQAKGSAMFEKPKVLGKWRVKRVGPTERAVHNTFQARDQWIEDAPGREWFRATVQEVEEIVRFVARL